MLQAIELLIIVGVTGVIVAIIGLVTLRLLSKPEKK
jgi:hypothetical protein